PDRGVGIDDEDRRQHHAKQGRVDEEQRCAVLTLSRLMRQLTKKTRPSVPRNRMIWPGKLKINCPNGVAVPLMLRRLIASPPAIWNASHAATPVSATPMAMVL